MQHYCNKIRNTTPDHASKLCRASPSPLLRPRKIPYFRLPHWLGHMRFDKRHPGFCRWKAAFSLPPSSAAQSSRKYQRKAVARCPHTPSSHCRRPLSRDQCSPRPHASAFQEAWPLGDSGMRPGIVDSSPPAQGIVCFYCSSCTGVS